MHQLNVGRRVRVKRRKWHRGSLVSHRPTNAQAVGPRPICHGDIVTEEQLNGGEFAPSCTYIDCCAGYRIIPCGDGTLNQPIFLLGVDNMVVYVATN